MNLVVPTPVAHVLSIVVLFLQWFSTKNCLPKKWPSFFFYLNVFFEFIPCRHPVWCRVGCTQAWTCTRCPKYNRTVEQLTAAVGKKGESHRDFWNIGKGSFTFMFLEYIVRRWLATFDHKYTIWYMRDMLYILDIIYLECEINNVDSTWVFLKYTMFSHVMSLDKTSSVRRMTNRSNFDRVSVLDSSIFPWPRKKNFQLQSPDVGFHWLLSANRIPVALIDWH